MEFKHLDTYKQAQDLARQELKTLVQDKSKPLEERWQLYLKYGDGLASKGGWIYHPECFREKFGGSVRNVIEDNFYDGVSRNETIEMSQWIKYLEDILKWGENTYKVKYDNPDFDYDNWDKTKSYEEQRYLYKESTLTQEDIDAFKEEILEEFIWSFEFDW